jgi:hypothetical protein
VSNLPVTHFISEENIVSPLRRHFTIYVFGDCYMIYDLKDLSKEKLATLLKGIPESMRIDQEEAMIDFLDLCLGSLPESDPLFPWLARFASWGTDVLRKYNKHVDAADFSMALAVRSKHLLRFVCVGILAAP